MNQGEILEYLNKSTVLKPTRYELKDVIEKNKLDYKLFRVIDGNKKGLKLFMKNTSGHNTNINNEFDPFA